MRTMASVGSSMVGSGTLSTRTSSLPCQASAFISSLPPGFHPTSRTVADRNASAYSPFLCVSGRSPLGARLAEPLPQERVEEHHPRHRAEADRHHLPVGVLVAHRGAERGHVHRV